ncbi:MAG TPA: hypothetical protein DDZ55_11365, partial [Firmicutes bacterium]|nr:hypothetical protein [Bacillota bacterium]
MFARNGSFSDPPGTAPVKGIFNPLSWWGKEKTKMNCHRVQSLLSAYLDQELSPEERRLIRNHLFNC